MSIKVGLTLLIDRVKHQLKGNSRLLLIWLDWDYPLTKAGGSSHIKAAYSRIELKKLGRTVLVQYHVCCSNIPCVRVLGYIQERSATRLSGGGRELLDEPHLSANLKPIPEQHKWVIRRCIMADIADRFNIDAPLVHFE